MRTKWKWNVRLNYSDGISIICCLRHRLSIHVQRTERWNSKSTSNGFRRSESICGKLKLNSIGEQIVIPNVDRKLLLSPWAGIDPKSLDQPWRSRCSCVSFLINFHFPHCSSITLCTLISLIVLCSHTTNVRSDRFHDFIIRLNCQFSVKAQLNSRALCASPIIEFFPFLKCMGLWRPKQIRCEALDLKNRIVISSTPT